ncbi:porin family protein [Fulvivirgaceae bacterium BMA12]|uniref:Porin family protein n=1 Tax=Agaribacillus aureus TaxID=3051825 RepID=A0ABT8LH73_9BACT|nr:porin family protein [Fulvivirgaceae bacterium BMA12]
MKSNNCTYYHKLKIAALWLMLCLFVNSVILAQDCARTLDKAENSYENGQLREVPQILAGCLKNGFNKPQKEQSYKLLVLTYLFLDDIDKAETYLLELLKSNPQFKVSEIDPPEFVYLYNGFRTRSYFSIGITGGVNNTLVNTLSINGAGNVPLSYQRNATKTGYQIGLGINFRVWQNLELSAEVNMINRRFKQTDSLKTTFYVDAEQPLGYNFSIIDAAESQIWMDFPITLKYGITKEKIQPFVYAGASFSYLLGSNLNITRWNIDPADIETPQRSVDGPPIKLLKSKIRDKYHYSALAGAGFKYNIGVDYLVFNVRYYLGLTNLRNDKAPLDADDELLFRYGYIDDNFRINSVALSIGYIKPFYKPKKLKKKH